MAQSMTNRDWELFFVLVNRIVDGPGTCQEKADILDEKAEEFGSSANLCELGSWIEQITVD